MGKRSKQKSAKGLAAAAKSKSPPARLAGVIVLALFAAAVLWNRPGKPGAEAKYKPRPSGSLTFNKNIAPILHRHCAVCHRPDQSAPFSLLTYADAKKRAPQIADVTGRHFMPPWLPESGLIAYADERRLSAEQIGMIRQWAEEGASEGNARDLPPAPQWAEGWQLGKPDLVIQMPEPFNVPGEGKDVYRNFVLPIPVAERKFIEAVEFRPGNPRVVHHAGMRIDRTRQSRLVDARDPGPGFGGMAMPESTEAPDGHFLNWQPGKLPYRAPAGMAWTLSTNTDFVVQLHLHPTGKPEPVQCSVGFYFTATPPEKTSFKVILDNATIDIPAGETNYVLEDTFQLPVDVEAHVVFPHAHYLGKDLQTFAMLPDGRRQWLLHIPEWDFNWQGDYRFAQPVFLPKGTTLHMRFTYDNSTNNIRNPHAPPQRVRFGAQSSDEMGEVWLQVTPRNVSELAPLKQAFVQSELKKLIRVQEHRIRLNPRDATAQLQLGKALVLSRSLAAALPHLSAALAVNSQLEEAYYFTGLALMELGNATGAIAAFENALRLNPNYYKAHGYLGVLHKNLGNPREAELHFKSALAINPDDSVARYNLELLKQAAKPK